METGLSVASADDDSAADGGGGTGPGGDVLARSRSSVPAEETRRCNAHRAARPPIGRSPRGAPLTVLPIAAVGAVGAAVLGGGHNRQKKQKQRQQQQLQQQQPQHAGGKKQKKQQKWKSNKYRGAAKGGRKDKAGGQSGGQSEDGSVNNGIAGDDGAGPAGSKQSAIGDNPPLKIFSEVSQQQQQQQSAATMATTTAASQTQATTTVLGQEGTKGSTSQQQKGKHSKQQNLSPMGLRNKRLQCASKYFLPDKRPRKDCIVPPTKFLLGGNISDPLNLNSLQNESENAVTPKSSPIPTPPHYKAKIEVIIPPNINDPLHLLDPVDSVEYEMQLCSPMKRKQRPRNKRKRKSRTAGTERSLSEAVGATAAAAGAASSSMLLIEQLPPPGSEQVEGAGTAGGVLVGAAGGGVEATTAEEASFTGIGQKLSEAINSESYPACSSAQQVRSTLLLAQGHSTGTGPGASTASTVAASVGANVGGGGACSSNVLPSGTAPPSDLVVDREREKAMRNLKLDLEASGGRKRRTSESTNSTKNKVRRMDSMDKIVSPVIPQPGGWKRGHWPAGHTGSGGAAGGERGRNRTRTYSSTSNADDETTGATEREGAECPVQERVALHSEHISADAFLGQVGDSVATGGAEGRVQNNHHDRAASCESRATSTCEGSADTATGLQYQGMAEGEQKEFGPERVMVSAIETVPRTTTAKLPVSSRYHHGNYDRYYGYHSLNEFIDVRLKVFLRNPYLFREKDVLDIGCNVGLMTIAVAKMLQTKSATGIDVDGKLIAKARKNLANYVRVPRKLPTAMSAAGAKRRSGPTATVTSATISIKDEVSEAGLEQETHERSGVKVENEAAAEEEEEEKKQRLLSTGEQTAAPGSSTNLLSVVEETITSHPNRQFGTNEEESGSLLTATTSAMVVEGAADDAASVNQPLTVPAASSGDGDEDAVQSGAGGVEANAHSSIEEAESDRNNPRSDRQREIVALLSKLKQKRRRKRFPPRQGGRHQHHHHHHHHHHNQHHQHHHHQNQHGKQSGGGHQHHGNAGGRSKTEQTQFFPISFPLTMGNLTGKECQMDIGHPEHKFPHNVRFKTMNYVLKEESLINYDTQQYDLILCLSVTKWIHLNYGDAGLKIAFKRMFNHLRPGGKLILEAQNWASYKKKKKLTETIFENYKNIEFFPCRFHDYLLSPEVGFSHSYPLGIPRHLSKGFRRPIQLYIKGDFTPSQAKWSDTYHPATPYENHRGIYTDIVTASQSAAGCIWGAMTPYAPSYSYRQPPTPSHSSGGANGGSGSGGGGASGSGNGFASTSPYYNPRQTDSYLPSYDNYGNGYRPGSYCFASPLYSTTWSPPSDMLATSGGGGGSYRRSASNTPNSASIRSTDNDEHYYAGTVGGSSQRRHHVYPPIDVFQPLLGQEHMRLGAGFRGGNGGNGGGGGAMTDSDSELSSNSASQTPTRQQQLAGSFLIDDQSNSPSGHSQPDK